MDSPKEASQTDQEPLSSEESPN